MVNNELAFGYLPKGKGGRQVTGLATGLFDLHNAVNKLQSDVQVYIAATDIFDVKRQVDQTVVLGWSKKLIVFHALRYFYRLPFFFVSACYLMKYRPVASFIKDFVKLLFLDYAIDVVKPNRIHLHGCFYALFARMIWKKNIPIMLRIHGINGFDSTIPHYQIYHKIEKAIVSIRFNHVTFVTTSICDEWKERLGSFNCPMTPIINGFNPNIFSPSTVECEKKYDLITIAGLSERKGQIRVMEAMKMCKENGINLSYVIVGDDKTDYGRKLKKYAEDNHLDVLFTGYLTQYDACKYLHFSKFFIQPSASEGFGLVYIESIGAGVPVIIPQTLPISKEKGILSFSNALFTEDETVDSIYNVIKSLPVKTFDPKIISSTVQHLSWENVAKDYLKLYKG